MTSLFMSLLLACKDSVFFDKLYQKKEFFCVKRLQSRDFKNSYIIDYVNTQ